MIGMTPRQVDECSFWEFGACIEGHNAANSTGDPPAPSNDEFDMMVIKAVKVAEDRKKMH